MMCNLIKLLKQVQRRIEPVLFIWLLILAAAEAQERNLVSVCRQLLVLEALLGLHHVDPVAVLLAFQDAAAPVLVAKGRRGFVQPSHAL